MAGDLRERLQESLGRAYAIERGESQAPCRVVRRKGQPREAMSHYSKFIDLWKNADPDLQPHVQKAKERLAQLQRAEP